MKDQINEQASVRFDRHDSSFGFLRLLFASLVILSHTPELIDGDRHREILTNIFGTLTFGETAVNGFFLISGYLITGSFMTTGNAWRYLIKRITRIYPGFLVATLICILIVGPLGGAALPTMQIEWFSTILSVVTLQPPNVGSVFFGTPYAAINGSMWTISYEFRCYLLVFTLGLLGIFSNRTMILLLMIALVILSVLFVGVYMPANIDKSRSGVTLISTSSLWHMLAGGGRDTIRLTMVFLVGSSYYLFKEKVIFIKPTIILAILLLTACSFSLRLANAGQAIFGGYLILASAQRAHGSALGKINNATDISYGVYLYAFPITKLLIWFWPSTPILMVGVITFVLACLCGWLSWLYVEKPAIEFIRARSTGRAQNSASTV